MTYTRKNQGVCSSSTTVTIDENGIITDAQVVGGCNGNLKGIVSLLIGQPAAECAKRMEGITCGMKASSCPDQIAKCINEALAQA
ncbi:MAG: TIGR03905 family TSCPD domain-containing protein [Oscillospiraceae bacterium]|nr:TIGR03905 family TSCPD domain-containing protein [Oscillospiraceae bacterium]MBQ9959500.1 TIGR03905 family TSCPD domain-containing protein [Oscillospiraceae bacterium]